MTDETLQADHTRDFNCLFKVIPSKNGFYNLGFYAHWKPNAAMFRKDWTAKPNAAVWRECGNGK
jgi:hypothetical protein